MVAISMRDLLTSKESCKLEYNQITRVHIPETPSIKETTTYQSITLDGASTEPNAHKSWLTQSRNRSGILFAIIASVCIVGNSTFMYVMSTELSLYQINTMVIPVQLIGSALMMIIKGVQPSLNISHLLWIQPSGFLLAGANYFNVYACKYMATSDATIITHVSLFLVGVLSFLILKELFSVIDISMAVIAFLGVMCVARPTFIFDVPMDGSPDTSIVLGTSFALASAFCRAPSYVFIRKQGLIGVHPLQSTFANAITKEVVSLALCVALGEWQSPTMTEWLCAFGSGVFYLIAHLTLFMALSRETAPAVSVILTVEVIVSLITQMVLFGVAPLLTSWVGALLVVAACIGTAANERIPSDERLVK